MPTTLSCKPVTIPNQTVVATPTPIKFLITNNGNTPVNYVVFIAYCDGYSNCEKFQVIAQSPLLTIDPGKTQPFETTIVFKQAGYFGIGVYDHTNKGFACGWIIQVLQQGQPPSHPGQPGQPGNLFGMIGQIMQILPMIIVIPLVLSIVGMLSNAIRNVS